ncbi:MAG: carbohydrate kinase [Elainella sp. C42_A2020_010]|nr:carbohydrate kinase [Elainella sp. C42_A2020_010]
MINPPVLCLGEILWDCWSDQADPLSGEVAVWTRYPGGAPANVACALTKLGTPAGFIGCVGEDGPGEALVELLQTLGVNTAGIQRHATAPTRQVEVLRSSTGDRQFVGFIGGDTTVFADTHLQAKQLPVELFSRANFLVTGTLGLAYPETQQAIRQALALAEQYDLKILMDVNWRPVFWPEPDIAKPLILDIVKAVDFLKLSVEEAEWLFETTDPSLIAQRLPDLAGVLLTAGEQGCTYWLSGNAGQIPAFAVAVADTTGAGDSFVAGFLHQLCQHGTPALNDPTKADQMVRYASAVGALTTTRMGAIAAQPTPAEVSTFLQSFPSSETKAYTSSP